MKTLQERLAAYSKSDFYPFHMPGHKRNTELLGRELPYALDITEIEGFDDLHHPQGILKAAEEEAAKVFGAAKSHFLVNGSTGGILAAIKGIADIGETLLVARNCHKSVYNGLEMFGLKAVYLYPEVDPQTGICGPLAPETVNEALRKHPEVKGLVMTSPTYEGVVSAIGEIAEVLHQKGLPLVVDEAHGAHFGFHETFPMNSNYSGADVVIHSLHKTLPSLTGTGLIHLNGEIIDRQKVVRMLGKLQTSSPSYLLMASIDACVHFLQSKGVREFARYGKALGSLREELTGLSQLTFVQGEIYESSKLVIGTWGTSLSGPDLEALLREEYHLQLEMVTAEYVVAMTSVCDREDGFSRLEQALFAIDKRVEKRERRSPIVAPRPKKSSYSIAQSVKRKRKNVILEEAAGFYAADYIYLYPPGVPLVIPGEEITEEIIAVIFRYQEEQLEVRGVTDQRIEVIDFG